MKTHVFAGMFLAALLFSPSYTEAKLVVSEIAWMGTNVSHTNEWIELSNTGTDEIFLEGFTLSAEDGSPRIDLSGTIAPGGFHILERTADDTLSAVAADQIYTGALSNQGETLVLRDGQGTSLQRVEASSGWPAGDNDTKETMQFSGGEWITAPAAPRHAARTSAGAGEARTPKETSAAHGGLPAETGGSVDESALLDELAEIKRMLSRFDKRVARREGGSAAAHEPNESDPPAKKHAEPTKDGAETKQKNGEAGNTEKIIVEKPSNILTQMLVFSASLWKAITGLF